MKKIFLFTAFLCYLTGGCSDGSIFSDEEVHDMASSSGIIVRTSKVENLSSSNSRESVAFTGNDILWFNETTREIRFNNNLSMKTTLSNVEALRFYIDDEYLFSAFVYMNSSFSQKDNSLILFYNATENKFFLLKSDPSTPVELYPNENQTDPTDGNRPDITSKWEKFVDLLKKEGKYK